MTIDVKTFAQDNNEMVERMINRRKEEITKLLAGEPDKREHLFGIIKELGFATYKMTMVALHYMVEEGSVDGMSPYDKAAPDDTTKHWITLCVD